MSIVRLEIIDLKETSEIKRFSVGQKISTKEVLYSSASEASLSPIAKKLFGFPWTESVSVGPTYIDVKKQDWVDWDVLAEPLAGLIQEHFEIQFKKGEAVEENTEPPPKAVPLSSNPLAQKIHNVIEAEVNPSVAAHGGRVSLIDVKDDQVFVRLDGGCQGCAMSQATLKDGIETTIRSHFPQIKKVLDVTDHAMGQNPYFVG